MSTLSRANSAQVNRRTIIRSAAWTIPVVSVIGVAAPAFACSVTGQEFYSADLKIDSVVGTRDENGHTIGTFTFQFCNNGQATIPAGTSYTVTLDALKAPGNPSGDKSILVGVGQHAGTSVSPTTPAVLNPDGPTKAQSYIVTVTSPVAPSSCSSVTFSIDTATGIGATVLQMTAELRDFGGNPCAVAAPGNQSRIVGRWGHGPAT